MPTYPYIVFFLKFGYVRYTIYVYKVYIIIYEVCILCVFNINAICGTA